MSVPSIVQVTPLLTALGLLRPAGSRPGSNLTTGSADTCRRIEFRGEVEHGQAWQRELGGALEFRLDPSADPILPGWTIEIRSHDLAESENELTWVVTLPYRGWNPRYLDVSYGLTAREVVARDVRGFGIVHVADYAQTADAVRTLLWPYGKTDQELATADRPLRAKELVSSGSPMRAS